MTFNQKVEARYGLVIFMIIWTLIAIGMLSFTTYGFITAPDRISDMLLFWIVLLLAVFSGSNYISWQLRGAEVIQFKSDHLELKFTGVFSVSNWKINYSEIENITFDTGKSVSYTQRFWGVGGGKIVIHYLGKTLRYGQDISITKAKSLSQILLNEVNNRIAHNTR